MNTPIADFVREYAQSEPLRMHMPGHKGRSFLGCEALDITEIPGADTLYAAQSIIAQSQQNTASLFGSGASFHCVEGSSQCIRAMVHMAATRQPGRAMFLAARNAHKAFLYALALADADVTWLWPEESDNLCSCPITPAQLEQALQALPAAPAAVYVTSPDYLGNLLPIEELARVCHRYHTPLLVDNAHGAYLHFLPQSQHPIALGADMCCDSAHKTLPVLTGGAWLHIGKSAPEDFFRQAEQALALHGSTSPSYLILASLDLCNDYLSRLPAILSALLPEIEKTKSALAENGWQILPSEPLKITLRCPGIQTAEHLRRQNIFCEYADRDILVLMLSPETGTQELSCLVRALGKNPGNAPIPCPPRLCPPPQEITVRQALFAPQDSVAVSDALGRIAAAPLVSCPPAIPIVISGERITAQALALLEFYGIDKVCVML